MTAAQRYRSPARQSLTVRLGGRSARALIAPALFALAFNALLLTAGTAHAQELPSARKLATSKKLCERSFHKQEKPRRSVTRICAYYWLFAYNYSLTSAREVGVAEALSLDPRVTGVETTRFSRAMFAAMAKHARKLPKRARNGEDWLAKRAVEYFEGVAASKRSIVAINACSGTLACLLKKIFEQEKLNAGELGGLDALHLQTLRLAVYARHGRRFKNSDANKLFYSDVAERESDGLLPRRRKSGYSDSKLTASDQANLALIRALEKNLVKDWRTRMPLFLHE